jgi:hypothetical protein
MQIEIGAFGSAFLNMRNESCAFLRLSCILWGPIARTYYTEAREAVYAAQKKDGLVQM